MTPRKIKVWSVLLTITSLIYILWRLFFTLPLHSGIVSLIAGITLFAAELVSNLEAIINMRCISQGKELQMPDVPRDLFPHIDVLIATHSEDADLLLKTVNGCCHMTYPDPSKVHIYLCDDMNRPEIAALAKKMGVGYFGLTNNQHAKAGNLNNAIAKTDSPLIVTFDADMIPRTEFLMQTVPYFFLPVMIKEDGLWRMRTEEELDKNYKIGFIQTPQSFYNPDLFQFNFFAENNIPNEQDYFFRQVNLGRNATNSAIYAGSNTVISREALEEVGGIRVGTITEDFATGIDIQAKGYTTYAISTVLASGLAPSDFASLLKQRQRWGRGCVQTVRSLKFWTNHLPLMAKLSYLNCLFYWLTFIRRIIYIMSPIIFVLFNVLIVDTSLLELACIWLPSYLIYNHTLRMFSGKTRNQRWSNIVDTIICPYMIVPILLELVGLRLKKFSVTSKEKVTSKSTQFYYAAPHIVLLAAIVPALVKVIYTLIFYRNFGTLVVFFWLGMNSYFLVMAILFMTGRVNFRSSVRYYAKIPVKFCVGSQQVEAFTSDISENGFSFLADFPEYIPFQHETAFTFYENGLSALVHGKVVHVEQQGTNWKYSIQLIHEDNAERLEYLQIVYDREPSLATQIHTSAYKDLSIFAHKKTNTAQPANRKLPRILLKEKMTTAEGVPVTVEDFNYQYITITGLEGRPSAQLRFTPPLEILLNLEKTGKDKLYKIINWEDIADTPDLRYALQNILLRKEMQYGS